MDRAAVTPQEFADLIAPITAWIGGRALDEALGADLNRTFPPSSTFFRSVPEGCRAGIAARWMCNREGGGIKYGRVVKPSAASHGFSVDMVKMENLARVLYLLPQGAIEFTKT